MPPFDRKVIDTLSTTRFGNHYDPQTGVVQIPSDYRLKQGVGDVTEEKLNNRYVRFFVERNPGWREGDELACMVPLRPELLHDKARKLIFADPRERVSS
jgi:hypothetical protein